MATTPTQLPVPSEKPQDLKFNAGKIDEFATSMGWTYTDRLGVKHYTIEGLKHLSEQAISAFGYITLDSFEDGANLTLPNQILRWKSNGEYYRWDGNFPKAVVAGSIPDSSGGIGNGKWLSVGAAALASPQDGAGDALIAVKQPFSGALIRTQHDKNAELITPQDFDTFEQSVSAAIASGGMLLNSKNTFILTVGSGGQFATLMAAIETACALRPTWKKGNGFCEIRIKSGFVLAEQMFFDGGVDLSWIKITAEDPVVMANTTSFISTGTGYYTYKYLFYFQGDVKSPLFAIQIEENRSGSDVCAFMVTQGAKLYLYPYSGARKFYVGVHAAFSSEVIGLHTGGSPGSPELFPAGYYVSDFSYSIKSALEAMSHVRVHLPISKFEYNQDATQYPAVFCIYGAIANFFGSSASHSNFTGWIVRDGCTVNLRYHKTIQCANIGLHCIHGAFVDARCDHTNETDATTSGKVLDPSAVLGFNGCFWGVRCESASNIEVAGTDFRNCTIGLQLATSANISGKACDFSGCDLVVQALSGVHVSIPRLYADSVGKFCELQYGSQLTVWNLNISRNTSSPETRFIDARHNSVVSIYNSIRMDSSIGLVATDGSRMSISTGNIKVPAVRSFEGSQVSLSSVTFDVGYVTTAVKQLIISAGSTITAVTCTNSDASALTLSTTKNTLSIAGTIFAS